MSKRTTLSRAEKKELAFDLGCAVGHHRVQGDTMAHYWAPNQYCGEFGDKYRALAPSDLAAQMSSRDKGWMGYMANTDNGEPPKRPWRRFRRWGIARLSGGLTPYGRSVALALGYCLHDDATRDDGAVCPSCGRVLRPWGYWDVPRTPIVESRCA